MSSTFPQQREYYTSVPHKVSQSVDRQPEPSPPLHLLWLSESKVCIDGGGGSPTTHCCGWLMLNRVSADSFIMPGVIWIHSEQHAAAEELFSKILETKLLSLLHSWAHTLYSVLVFLRSNIFCLVSPLICLPPFHRMTLFPEVNMNWKPKPLKKI